MIPKQMIKLSHTTPPRLVDAGAAVVNKQLVSSYAKTFEGNLAKITAHPNAKKTSSWQDLGTVEMAGAFDRLTVKGGKTPRLVGRFPSQFQNQFQDVELMPGHLGVQANAARLVSSKFQDRLTSLLNQVGTFLGVREEKLVHGQNLQATTVAILKGLDARRLGALGVDKVFNNASSARFEEYVEKIVSHPHARKRPQSAVLATVKLGSDLEALSVKGGTDPFRLEGQFSGFGAGESRAWTMARGQLGRHTEKLDSDVLQSKLVTLLTQVGKAVGLSEKQLVPAQRAEGLDATALAILAALDKRAVAQS